MKRDDEFVTVDGVELHYSAWGDPDDPPVVCVHGLSRVGRDFDPLARELATDYRVLCPDMPGRGWSEWVDEPGTAYTSRAMLDCLVGFCDRLDLQSIRWIGTSMGGGLGIALAGGQLADRITHLVVNDAGPDPLNETEIGALERIVEYVGDPPEIDTLSELEAYYRDLYEPFFSEMTDAEWRRFTVTSARRTDDGKITTGYDPRILEALVGPTTEERDTDPLDVWEAIDADVFVIRGIESAVLPEDVFETMLDRRPDARSLEVDCGHAPALNVPEQIQPIEEFLAE